MFRLIQRFNPSNSDRDNVCGMADKVLKNARLAQMTAGPKPYGLLDGAALVMRAGRIDWIGVQTDLPGRYGDLPTEDIGSRLVTPALIDCHTHLVFGGNRAGEFELRLQGASYAEIARHGGGIVSTVRHTRAMGEDDLVAAALPRLDALLAEGVCSVEIKSGYGLTIEDELKMLRVARRLGRERTVQIRTTYLGAHAIPEEYAGRADDYISDVCLPALDIGAKEGLIDSVDAFCEAIAFTPDQVERVFLRARQHGIPVKLHAEQLSNSNGAALAARYGALSADHLEFLDDAGVREMAKSGTVAVLLPGAFYTLRETRMPPVDALRRAAIPIAIATDCNPGSSPLTSLLLAMNMASTIFRLTPEEALAGTTREAAKALGLQNDEGTLEIGKRANLAIWDVKEPAELVYRIGFIPLYKRIYRGV